MASNEQLHQLSGVPETPRTEETTTRSDRKYKDLRDNPSGSEEEAPRKKQALGEKPGKMAMKSRTTGEGGSSAPTKNSEAVSSRTMGKDGANEDDDVDM